jgi:hypothetical protein
MQENTPCKGKILVYGVLPIGAISGYTGGVVFTGGV